MPRPSLINDSLPRFDYEDAFEARFASAGEPGVEDAFRAFFRTAPGPVVALMKLRNAVVKRLGLKAPAGDPEALDRTPISAGSSFGLFRIYAVGPDEVLAGEDDSHLDFRVVVRLAREPHNGGYLLTVATAVRTKNMLGRLYFMPVRVFHRLIVPAMVGSMAGALADHRPRAAPKA